jgi:hypothetical protein
MPAIYGCEVKIIGRSKGRSIVSAAAYRSASQLYDRRNGREYDFSKKLDVVHDEILLPSTAPHWMHDREALWNGLEAREHRKDAQLSREVVLTLPRQLSDAQRLTLVRGFAIQMFVKRGMLVDLAIHNPRASDGKSQPHCHLLLGMREVNESGWGLKRRDWNPQFANARRPKGFVRDTEALVDLRSNWAKSVNQALDRAGVTDRVDHRSLASQLEEKIRTSASKKVAIEDRLTAAHEAIELDRVPQPKSGIARRVAERKGAENASDREKKAQLESENRQKERSSWFVWFKAKLLKEAQSAARLGAQRALIKLRLNTLILKQKMNEVRSQTKYIDAKSSECRRRWKENIRRTQTPAFSDPAHTIGPDFDM